MIEKLKKIYVKIPFIECKKKCHEACSLILMNKAELDIIIKRIGYNPFGYVDIEGLASKVKLGGVECLKCPLLTEYKKCSIYDIRPLICRLYGVVKKMKCPYGCKPKKWLSDIQASTLRKKVRELSEEDFGGNSQKS